MRYYYQPTDIEENREDVYLVGFYKHVIGKKVKLGFLFEDYDELKLVYPSYPDLNIDGGQVRVCDGGVLLGHVYIKLDDLV